ncbi:hypothetical protein JXO52_12990 [bacterium]|nr:hypothetical protein [bacterium]
MSRTLCISLVLAVAVFAIPAGSAAQTSPDAFFGRNIGSDRVLIPWEGIHKYFLDLDDHSDRVAVQELGRTTGGRPMIMAIISSSDNMRELERYRTIQRELANPFNLDPGAADALISEGKIVVMITMNIHSTEIASSQEALELAWELATGSDEPVNSILDQVILLLVPSLNPDGQQMVADWYTRYAGSEYEGCSLPMLYHHYAGHDNNRDWFMFSLQESRLVSKVLYRDWFPEIVFDQHQMGSSGPRMFLPPYSDPINLNVYPELMAEVNMLGQGMIADLHLQGFTGITSDMGFNAYFQGTMSKTPLWHNMVGILSEMASVRIASPIFMPRGSLGSWGPERMKYSARTDFLSPWPGGWWRLRDIVDYEKAATYSLLEQAAAKRATLMRTFYRLNRRSIEEGEKKPPYAYVIPRNQHDPGSAEEMLKRLQYNGIAVYVNKKPLRAGDAVWYGEEYVIPLAQPCRQCIKDLLECQLYPNLTQYPGGPPERPYDFAGWTLPLQMGVEVIPVNEPLAVPLAEVNEFRFVPSAAPASAARHYFERRNITAYGFVNDLLRAHVPVHWTERMENRGDTAIPRGTFYVEDVPPDLLLRLMEVWHVAPVFSEAAAAPVEHGTYDRVRLGIYQPWTASIDEGWTRLVLDNFHFEYTVLHNEDVKKGRLSRSFDVIILPSIGASSILSGRENSEEPGAARIPEQYLGGIGKQGADALADFVREGGTLAAIGGSTEFAIDILHLPVRDVVRDMSTKEFFVPGSLLDLALDTTHPLTWGMQEKTAVRFAGHPVFRLYPYVRESRAVGFYEDGNPLLSGWLIGDEMIAGHTALAEIPVEAGRVILYGFGVQSRAQTWGTFKLLFNAVFADGGREREPDGGRSK